VTPNPASPASSAVPSIAVVDYGMGNRRSVEKALQRVGAHAHVTRDHRQLRAADGLLLPGVGAFPAAMATIHELGLDELLHERAAAGVPLFGSCMGMQLLFERSEEHGGADGLGLLRGEVRRLNSGAAHAGAVGVAPAHDGAVAAVAVPAGEIASQAPPLKLPHIGWSEVRWRRRTPLNEGLPDPAYLYHVHSFVAYPADPEVVLGTAEYGEVFPAVVEFENIFGAQSHPEKSSTHGLRLLRNFVAICAAAAGAQLRLAS
jgi:imidazole glycerol-phosphate synthase subunit HisH